MSKNRHVVIATTKDRKGRTIARRSNNYEKTHPLQAFFARQTDKPEAVFLHAEIAAILASGDRQIHSIHVERYKRDGTEGLAKPCAACQAAIKAFGIRHITYTGN